MLIRGYKTDIEFYIALARYACHLDQYADASKWISLALTQGGEKMKLRIIDEPDLRKFWMQVGEQH